MSKLEEKIKNNLKKVKPNPRWEFLLLDFIKELIIVIFWIFAVVFLGICIYILSAYNPLEIVFYDKNLILNALIGLPWEIFIASVFLVLGIYFLSKRIFFIYRLNSVSLIVIIFTSIFLGFFIAEKLGLNEKISNSKIVNFIYENQGKILFPKRGFLITGKIKDIKEKILYFEDKDCLVYKIDLEKVKIKNNFLFNKGDYIKLFAIKNNFYINVWHIIKLPNDIRGLKNKINCSPTCNCSKDILSNYEN